MQNIPLFSSEEEQLKDSLNRYEQMINNTPICIKVFDPAGKLIFINKGGRDEHFIKDSDDISKWDWVGTVKKEFQPLVLDAFKRGLQGEASEVFMEHTPEGSSHEMCEGIISPIKGKDGKVNLLLFYSIDATAKMKAKHELEKREAELEKNNEELQKLNTFMVGRELDMARLKQQIQDLEKAKAQNTK